MPDNELDDVYSRFDEMTPFGRDCALLALINKLSTINELQSESIGELQDRVKTLELSTEV